MHIPLAHTEGGLTASMTRGALAAGTVRTYVLHDRITRASCFVCRDAAEAVALARWIECRAARDARVARRRRTTRSLSRHAKLREVKTHVVGQMCHVLWAWTTGDAVGPNMMTRNSYALNMGYVMQRAPVKPERSILEANMGGDKKPSHEYFQSGHGKTVLAEAFLSDEQIRRVLRTTAEPISTTLSWAGTHGAIASGMQSVAFTPGVRGRRGVRGDGPGSGHGRARARWHTAPGAASTADSRRRSASAGSRSAPSAAARRSPPRATGSTSIGCAGPGKVYRFAQIVAAAALCLEISASAAMATAGSENFFQAHHERGGLR